EGADGDHLDALVPRQLGEAGEKVSRIAGAHGPSHVAKHGSARAQLRGHLLLAEPDLLGEAAALVRGPRAVAHEGPPLRELVGEEGDEDEGHGDPGDDERAPRHGARSANTMLTARSCSPEGVAMVDGLISQLLSAKRRLTAGSRMRPAMNCATSTRGALPGRASVRASMRSVSSPRVAAPAAGPAPDEGAGRPTSTSW